MTAKLPMRVIQLSPKLYLCRRTYDVFNSKRMSKYLRCVNVVTNGDIMVGQYFDTMTVASSDRVAITTHQNLSAGNCFERPQYII